MATVFEIPLVPGTRQSFSINLSGIFYNLRLAYADDLEAGWFMDISDTDGNPLACGLPLVTGADLLEQYAYLGIGGKMFVLMNNGVLSVPGFSDLGAGGRLYFETP